MSEWIEILRGYQERGFPPDLNCNDCKEIADEIDALRKAMTDGAEGAFLAHMEERRLREAAEAERDRLAEIIANMRDDERVAREREEER